MFIFQTQKTQKNTEQKSGIYQFHLDSLRTLNMTYGFDGAMRMNPGYLDKAISWIKKNGKKLESEQGELWSVEAKLLQPDNKKDKNSLYNFARKEFPKYGAKEFCKDISKMIREADDIYKGIKKEEDQNSGFLKGIWKT